MSEIETEVVESGIACPLCGSADFVKRLLFFTYCANPVHTHRQGEAVVNTILEFRQCVEHGVRDQCVTTVFEEESKKLEETCP